MLRPTITATNIFSNLQKRFISVIPKFLPKRADDTSAAPLHHIPGNEKRTKLDPRKRQPVYDSPYSGHPNWNPPPPGYYDDFDGYWDDKVQREWIYKDEIPWVSAKMSALWSAYLFGWACSIYLFYRYFIAPVRPLHPLVIVQLTPEQLKQAQKLIAERRAEMDKYGITMPSDEHSDE
jgi:hypothetical protein